MQIEIYATPVQPAAPVRRDQKEISEIVHTEEGDMTDDEFKTLVAHLAEVDRRRAAEEILDNQILLVGSIVDKAIAYARW